MSPTSSRGMRNLLLIFFCLFAFSSAFSIAMAQISLGMAVLCSIGIVIFERRSPKDRSVGTVYLWMGLYVLWLVISSLFGDTPFKSIEMLREEWLFLAVPVGMLLLREGKFREWLVLALAAGVIIASIYGITQRFTGVDWITGHPMHTAGAGGYRPGGFFSYPLTYGNYIAVAALFLVGYGAVTVKHSDGWKRWLIILAAILAVVAAFLSNSRGPVLATATGLLIASLLLFRWRYVVPVVIAVGLLAIPLAPGLVDRLGSRFQTDFNTDSKTGRLHIWSNTLTILADNPITGVGAGNFEAEYYDLVAYDVPERHRQRHAHNDLLNVAVLSGLPGLIIYLGLWIAVAMRLLKGARDPARQAMDRAVCTAALIASVTFFVCSLTEAAFADEEVRQLLMLIWGIGLTGVVDKNSGEVVIEKIAG
ncbi:MAG: O-antigen ligase family protein [Candidatus Zixiibacteriota bacterium]|nr:MAG: O-antigen ligase family protein [candidate division Zixibacteria bacterium]